MSCFVTHVTHPPEVFIYTIMMEAPTVELSDIKIDVKRVAKSTQKVILSNDLRILKALIRAFFHVT